MNFPIIRRLVALFAIAGLAACNNTAEVEKLQAEKAQLTAAAADTAARNKELSVAKTKAEQSLMAEQARASQLEKAVKTEHDLRRKAEERATRAEVRAAHLNDQVKGAKTVAGTAVDRSYSKGVEVGKAGGTTKTAKKAS